MARDFKKIKAWQHADDLATLVYSATRSFPREEVYGITSQLRRAAVSVAANIAEGASRGHKKEYLNFLYIARGSLAELEYLVHLAHRIGYLDDADYGKVGDMREETAKILHGLINSVADDMNDAGRL